MHRAEAHQPTRSSVDLCFKSLVEPWTNYLSFLKGLVPSLRCGPVTEGTMLISRVCRLQVRGGGGGRGDLALGVAYPVSGSSSVRLLQMNGFANAQQTRASGGVGSIPELLLNLFKSLIGVRHCENRTPVSQRVREKVTWADHTWTCAPDSKIPS